MGRTLGTVSDRPVEASQSTPWRKEGGEGRVGWTEPSWASWWPHVGIGRISRGAWCEAEFHFKLFFFP